MSAGFDLHNSLPRASEYRKGKRSTLEHVYVSGIGAVTVLLLRMVGLLTYKGTFSDSS